MRMGNDSLIPRFKRPPLSATSSVSCVIEIQWSTLFSTAIRKESAALPDLVFIIFNTKILSVALHDSLAVKLASL